MKIVIPTKRWTALLAFTLICLTTFAQKTVTGTVRDEAGAPLVGVTLNVKGSTTFAMTDPEGKFVFSSVKGDATLVASFLGYQTQEIPVESRSTINIVLKEESTDLDEVVVVGYGTQKKRDLTGSVGSISPKALTMKGTTTMLESMQGSIPGVSITQNNSRSSGGFNIQIRGIQSIGNSKGPLYVVDGIVVSDIQFLNPNDIERMDILKDASSTAIYGSRASEGVVMVTTKSAKTQGAQAAKPVVSYDGYVGSRQVARTPDFMDGMDFMKYRFSRYTTNVGRKSKDGSVKYQMLPANLKITLLTNIMPDTTTGSIVYGDLETKYPAGGALYPSNVEKLMAAGESYDWLDLVTRNGIQQNHFLSVSGAAAGTNYYFGMGYQQDQGIFLNDDEKRINLKSAIDTKINEYWTAGLTLNLARTTSSLGNDDAVANALWSNPYFIPWDENGVYYNQSGVTKTLGTIEGAQFSSMYNPLVDYQNTENLASKLHFLGNIYLQFSPIKNLTFKTTLSPSIYQGRTYYYVGVNTTARNSSKTDRAEVKSTSMFDYTWDNQVDYQYSINDHSFSLMGLYSVNKYTREYFNQYGENFPSNNTFYNMGQAKTPIASESGYTENMLLSFAGRLNYSYMGKYMATATLRSDGSSRFSKENRWGYFPSAAFAWRASEEEFLRRDWLNNLKLRYSYGESGNNNVDDYVTATMPSSTASYAFGTSYAAGYGPNGIVNAGLLWEKTSENNFGIDLSILNSRINLTADIYSKISDELLMKRTLALEAGGGATVMDNIGSISNKGFELSLNTVNVLTEDFRWETTLTFAKNKNNIEELYGGEVMQDLGNSWFVGSPLGVFYNYTYGGIVDDKPLTVTLPKDIVNGKLKDGTTINALKGEVHSFEHAYEFFYNTYGLYEGMPYMKDLEYDGVIDAKDKSIIGKNLPDWTGSFSTTIVYKNFDLSASAYAKIGYMVSSPFLRQYMGYNDRGRTHINFDYYIPAGAPVLNDDGTIGKQAETHYGMYPFPTDAMDNGGTGSFFGTTGIDGVYYLTEASFIKVKNISLGYTMPGELVKKIGFSSLRIYANVLNPFVFTDYKGFDPEWADAKLAVGGPSTITYQLGINAKF